MSSSGGFAGSITCALFLQAIRRHARRPGCISTSTPGTPSAKPGAAGRRRMPGGARALCAVCASVTADASDALDPRLTPARPDLAAKSSRRPGRSRALRRRHPRSDRPAGAGAPRALARAPLDTEALKGERVTVSRPTTKAGAGDSSRPMAMSAGCRRARSLTPGARRRTRSRRCARSFFPAPTSSSRRSTRCRSARGLRSRGSTALRRDTARAAIIPAQHLSPLDAIRRRFRRGRGALSRHALSVGRQDQSSASIARAWCRWRSTACGIACPRDSDMQEKALGERSVRALPSLQARRPDLLGAMSPSRATATPSSMPMRIHMAVAIEPLAEAVARIRAAGSEVTSVRRVMA